MSLFQKETISYKHFFTPEEKSENAQNLAQAQVGRVELEDEKKAVTSEYKAKIDAATSTVNLLSRHVIDGYTTKSGLFAKRKNFSTMQWEWFDEETGEVVKREPLTGKDRQMDVPLAEPAKAEKPQEEADDEETPPTPPLPPIDELHGFGKQHGFGSFEAIVTPTEVEDLNNGHEPKPETTVEPVLRLEQPGTLTLGPGGDEPTDDNDGDEPDPTAFDPDTYNPEPPQPPKNKGGRPRKNK